MVTSEDPVMSKVAAVIVGLFAAAVWPTALVATEHPGHGSKVVLGTLVDVKADGIVIEALDPAAGGRTRIPVKLDGKTRFRIDKEPLASLDGMVGQRAVVSVDWEDDDRGGQTLTATEVRFTRKKK